MHAAPCGIYAKTTCIYVAATSVKTLPHLLSQWLSKLKAFTFGCAKSQNLGRLREIAKNNTRKIVRIPKSQNIVLANNSNNYYQKLLEIEKEIVREVALGE